MVAARFKDGASAEEVYELAISHDNPVLARTQGWVTRAVMNHPLYQALEDLQARADIREGAPFDPGNDPTRPLFVEVASSPHGAAPLPQQT